MIVQDLPKPLFATVAASLAVTVALCAAAASPKATSAATVSDEQTAATTQAVPRQAPELTPEQAARHQELLDEPLDIDVLEYDEWRANLGTKAWDGLEKAPAADSSIVQVDGVDASGAAEQIEKLAGITQALEDDGYTVGYRLVDVETGVTISHDEDTAVYSASSVKGPFALSLAMGTLAEDDAYAQSLIRAAIVDSDNDAYRELQLDYGNTAFATLATNAGATFDGMYSNRYFFWSAADLSQLWLSSYDLLANGTGTYPDLMRETLSNVEMSPIRAAIGKRVTTWSKAGWYPNDDGDEWSSMCDGGIVRSQTGDYVIAICTNDPEDFLAVATLAAGLDDAHHALAVSTELAAD